MLGHKTSLVSFAPYKRDRSIGDYNTPLMSYARQTLCHTKRIV